MEKTIVLGPPGSAQSLYDEVNRLTTALDKAQLRVKELERQAYDLRTALIDVCDSHGSMRVHVALVRTIRRHANDTSQPFSFDRLSRELEELEDKLRKAEEND